MNLNYLNTDWVTFNSSSQYIWLVLGLQKFEVRRDFLKDHVTYMLVFIGSSLCVFCWKQLEQGYTRSHDLSKSQVLFQNSAEANSYQDSDPIKSSAFAVTLPCHLYKYICFGIYDLKKIVSQFLQFSSLTMLTKIALVIASWCHHLFGFTLLGSSPTPTQ